MCVRLIQELPRVSTLPRSLRDEGLGPFAATVYDAPAPPGAAHVPWPRSASPPAPEISGSFPIFCDPRGNGTAIALSVPRGCRAVEESSGEATGLPPETIRVLVVDDDTGVREMFLYALQKRGWYARGAEDGLQALRRLQDEAFTVVVTDLQMPRMDGLALLREMRRTRSLLPVVIQTTLLDRSLEEMLQQAGAFRVLMKGGPLGFLVQSVKDASKAYAGRPA